MASGIQTETPASSVPGLVPSAALARTTPTRCFQQTVVRRARIRPRALRLFMTDSATLTTVLENAGFVAAQEEAAELIEAAGGDAGLLDALVARRLTGEPPGRGAG